MLTLPVITPTTAVMAADQLDRPLSELAPPGPAALQAQEEASNTLPHYELKIASET